MSSRAISRRKTLAASLSMLLAAPALSHAAGQQRPALETLASAAGNAFLEITRQDGATREQFAALLEKYFAVRELALFALGKYRRKLAAAQIDEYVDLFQAMLLNTLTRYGSKMRGKQFVVTGSRDELVAGYIEHSSDRTTDVELRIADGLVSDVRVGGIWLALLMREQFNRIIDGAGGDVSALLQHLANEHAS